VLLMGGHSLTMGCDCDGSTVVVPVPGIPGPPGPQGPQGPPGVGEGSVGSYLHTQLVAAAVWTITHNLGQMIVEAAAVYSLNYGAQFYNVIVEPLDLNTCKLYFADPVSGYALIQR
jgi:hypothetical protein